MSDSTTPSTPDTTTDNTAKGKGKTPVVGPFPTHAEAMAHKPTDGKFSLFRITHHTIDDRYIWTTAAWAAQLWTLKTDGYTIGKAGDPPDKAKVAAMLSALSPAERAELLASLTAPAPAPTTPPATGDGKGSKPKSK